MSRLPPCWCSDRPEAHRSLAHSRDLRRSGLRLSQVEVERVQKLDSGARRVHGHVTRSVQERLGVVEDDLDARADDIVGHALRLFRRGGEYGHDDVLLADGVLELAVVADDRVADGMADLVLIGVEGGGDVEAVVGEDRRARDRLAESAGTEERDVVLALRAEDLADLRDEAVDVVADAPLAELPERREVAPDLRRIDVRVL